MSVWNLVLESGYRQAKACSKDNKKTLESIKMKILWCRTMKWMRGLEDAVADAETVNFLEKIEQICEGGAGSGEQDMKMPDLSMAMWRIHDMDVESEDTDAMKKFRAYHEKWVEEYEEYCKEKAMQKKKVNLADEESDADSDWGEGNHEKYMTELMEKAEWKKTE